MLSTGKRTIGNTVFSEIPLILAPMEDVTDPPFRMICKEMGVDWVYTEFISADGLIRDAAKSLEKLDVYPEERPVSIQIFGAHIDAMVEAAKVAEQAKPDFIDINFGCPVRKVAAKGAGAGMLNDIDKMVEMTRQIVQAVRLPVTVKTRLGWDQNNKNILNIALRLQDTGIAALAVHGRTRCQMYRGTADWTLIGELKNHPQIYIPIIGNGDVNSPESAVLAIQKYNVDGIMIGRACIGNPWIFRDVKHYFKTGEFLPEPDIAERIRVCKMHLQKSTEWKSSEKLAVFEMRRHYGNYFKGMMHFKPFRMRLVTAPTAAEVYDILDEIQDTYGKNR